jgi:DNA-binding PadR family transcriptional regulator
MPGRRTSDVESQTPLSAQVFQILLSLLDEDLHGYALIQDIRRRTEGEVVLTASTLYAATKRLLSAGWIDEVEPETPPPGHDPRRRYYRITAVGREAARAEALRLERLTAMARDKRLLSGFRVTPQAKGSR